MRCPHCKSSIRVLWRAPDACPQCGRALRDEGGRRVRELDQDFDALSARLDELTRERIRTGTIVCAALSLLNVAGPALPPLNVILPPVIFVQHVFWARPLVCGPYARHFGVARRMVTRWLSRFFVVSMASLHAHGVAVPVAQVIVSPLVFLGTCVAVRAYHRFHLRRERERLPVLLVEKVLLVLVALFVICAGVLLLVFASWLGDLLRSVLPAR